MRIGFEVNYDAGDVFIDNVVFTRITDVVPDAPVVNLSTANGIVTVAVEDNGASSYDVFFADSAFTETTQGTYVGTIDPANGLSLTHTTQAPHPDLVLNFDAHYGVVAKSEKGSASDMTASMINTATSVRENYIVELSEEAVEAVAGALETGVVPEDHHLPDSSRMVTSHLKSLQTIFLQKVPVPTLILIFLQNSGLASKTSQEVICL